MNDIERLTDIIMERIIENNLLSIEESRTIPIGISNRHIHLSKADLYKCFGEGYKLTPTKELSQIGQFACKETVTLCGPKGAIEKVRVLGPTRNESQVELLASDNYKLGTKAPLRLSGDIKGSSPITVIGPKGSVELKEGAIVAKRHIHMTPKDAESFGVFDSQIVDVKIKSSRGGVLSNVIIRVTETSGLDFHIDTEEGNALGIDSNSVAEIIK